MVYICKMLIIIKLYRSDILLHHLLFPVSSHLSQLWSIGAGEAECINTALHWSKHNIGLKSSTLQI